MADKSKDHYIPKYSPFWQPGDPLPEDDGITEKPDDESE